MQEEKSYCESRLEKYGITQEWNYQAFDLEKGERYEYTEEQKGVKFFSEGKDNGIDITYLTLYGQRVRYKPDNAKWQKPYIRTRLSPAKSNDDQKYTQPAGSGVHVHLNPRIIDKFKKGEHIETLFMVEGEFKHWLGYMNGLDMIGLPSIHAYKEKGKSELHETIRDIIRVCTVENLVMLYDADIHAVKWDKWKQNEHYDLGKRLNLFYQSAKNIRDFAKKLVRDVYAAHVNIEFLKEHIPFTDETVKGLDDLYLFCNGKEAEVSADLMKLRSSKKYFTVINLTADSPGQIRDFFHVSRDKSGKPSDFYRLHQDKIQDAEFSFMGFRYRWNSMNEELEILKHPDSQKFVRVACDYIKIITIPEIIRGFKVTRRKLEPWKSGELTRDYVQKGYKNFFDTIPKYDQFSVYPNNTEEYKQVIDNCFNLYYEVLHKPAPGSWDTIKMFLTHLFDDQLEMCYDYLKLLYLKPWQNLPIIALVSEERGTGKTKFLELLREMFCENVTILGNDAITDNYNDDYASKLVIGIDEGLIEKKATVEKIKSWSTATRIKMNTKFMSRQEIPFYGKIIITSNNVDSFIQIEDKETRFWVREIPKITTEDPQIMEKMEKEIPAFLQFLQARELKYPRVTRQWFANELLHTKALDVIKQNSHSWLHRELKTTIQELFYHYQYHQLYFTLSEITNLLNNKDSGARFRKDEIRKELANRFKIAAKMGRSRMPEEGHTGRLFEKPPGRYYCFKIEEFLNEQEITEIGYDLKLLQRIRTDNMDFELWPGKEYSLPGSQTAIFTDPDF